MAAQTKAKQPTRHYNCPVEAALDVIGGKWKVLIICWLKEGIHRFGELRRRIPGVSERMLTQQLRELERDGIVRRKVYPEVPPKVEYSLTDFGETLRPLMVVLNEWGEKHLKRIAQRRPATRSDGHG
jgi:DNA-binding HxlR family transcriptional regulator